MISAVLLAGGKSTRMGTEKALLELGHNKFVYRIARELLRVSDDLMIVIGGKDKNQFRHEFDKMKSQGFDPLHIRILNDQFNFENPVAGILTGFENARHSLAAVVACDMPLIRGNVIKYLLRSIKGFDCVVPIWEDYHIEPLCGVYSVRNSIRAAQLAIQDGKVGPKHMVSYIQRVSYVPVSSLRLLDPNLESLLNINSPREYEELLLSLSREKESVSDQFPMKLNLSSSGDVYPLQNVT